MAIDMNKRWGCFQGCRKFVCYEDIEALDAIHQEHR